jgi:hypothetical protein
MTENKEHKYEVERTKPILITTEKSENLISVESQVSTRKEDSAKFLNIFLVAGFKGDYGFVPSKYMSKIQLPYDLTDKDWIAIKKAYDEKVLGFKS